MTGVTPDLALPVSLRFGASVAELDGKPEGIFGCTKVDDLEGMPWFLGTAVPFSLQWVKHFHVFSVQIVDGWQSSYPLLHNFTDARNTLHHRWLQRLGFTFVARHDHYGPLGLPFFEFVRINPCAASPQP